MSVYRASLSGGLNTLPSPWADVKRTDSSVVLPDETGANTGKTIGYSTPAPFEVSAAVTNPQLGTGNASWVISEAMEGAHQQDDSLTWVPLVASGWAPGETVNVRCFSSYNAVGDARTTTWRVNGGASQDLAMLNNFSNDVRFNNVVADANGEFLIEWRKADGSLGRSTANAVYIEDVVVSPSLALDNNPQLGATLSGTYANFSGTPTGPIQLDQGARSLPDEAITVDSGAGTWVTDTALPGLPANGESVTPFPVIGADIDITLPDPGA